MANVRGGGGSSRWTEMNKRNAKKTAAWLKAGNRQVNKDKQVGVAMVQWLY